MAVTIDAAALAAAARVGDSPEETAEITRILAFSTTTVDKHLGAAFATTPETVVNEAVIRLGSYYYDHPTVARNAGFADAIRNSGAGAILAPYRRHRATVLS